MKKYTKYVYFLLALVFSLSILKCIAFFVPDINSLGKDPEIVSVEPDYLIPGERAKIKGKNFFELPKNANKLFINNYPVRIISSTNNTIEFIVPRLPLGNARLKFFTSYLGYKSPVIFYPQDKEKLLITFHAPFIQSVDSLLAKPKMPIFVYGQFNQKNDLFFKVGTQDVKGDLISKDACKLTLPEIIPRGPFKIKAFYRKHLSRKNLDIDSAISNHLLLYNDELGNPYLVKIQIPEKIINSFKDEYRYSVILYFKSGESADVTDYSEITSLDESVIDLNKANRTVKPIKNGIGKIKAKFIWSPKNLEFIDIQELSVQMPLKPDFSNVIIDEVFPFASGLIPATDANMDGFARTNEDEFIELKNLTNKTIDLSNCKFYISENKKPSFEFSSDVTIDPVGRLVIFGKDANDGKLNLLNSGTTIEFVCDEKTVDYIAYPPGKNGDHSWQRKNDLSGFEIHPVTLFSPGQAPPKVGLPVMQSSSSSGNIAQLPVLAIDSNNDIVPLQAKEISVIPAQLLFSEQVPQQLYVTVEFENGDKKDITLEASYKATGGGNLIKIESGGLISPLANGIATIEISYQDKTIELTANINLLSKVQAKQLIINETLAAPTVDVNKDGVFKSDQDEFIEIVNVSGSILDISNLLISDNVKVRHTIPQGTVLQNFEPIVIFGGGTLTNFSQTIKSQIASTGSLGINNTGFEQLTISTSDGRIIDQISFDNNNLLGASLNRLPDLSFNNLVTHDKFLKSIGKYSPGTRIDGTPFSSPPQEGSDLLKGSSSSSSSSSSGSSSLSTSSSSSGG